MKNDSRLFAPKTNFLTANYKEMLAAVAGLVAFFFISRGAIQRLDPTAGVTDFGTIDVIAFAFASLLVSLLFVWAMLRIGFKTFHRYLDGKEFRREFVSEAFGPRARIVSTLAVIFGLLWFVIQFAKLAAGLH